MVLEYHFNILYNDISLSDCSYVWVIVPFLACVFFFFFRYSFSSNHHPHACTHTHPLVYVLRTFWIVSEYYNIKYIAECFAIFPPICFSLLFSTIHFSRQRKLVEDKIEKKKKKKEKKQKMSQAVSFHPLNHPRRVSRGLCLRLRIPVGVLRCHTRAIQTIREHGARSMITCSITPRTLPSRSSLFTRGRKIIVVVCEQSMVSHAWPYWYQLNSTTTRRILFQTIWLPLTREGWTKPSRRSARSTAPTELSGFVFFFFLSFF